MRTLPRAHENVLVVSAEAGICSGRQVCTRRTHPGRRQKCAEVAHRTHLNGTVSVDRIPVHAQTVIVKCTHGRHLFAEQTQVRRNAHQVVPVVRGNGPSSGSPTRPDVTKSVAGNHPRQVAQQVERQARRWRKARQEMKMQTVVASQVMGNAENVIILPAGRKLQ